MINLSLADLVKIVGGKLEKGEINLDIQNVIKNPRKIKNNCLFFHIYEDSEKDLDSLQNSINSAIVTSRLHKVKALQNITVIKVEKIMDAYWKFVRYYRGLFDIPVIGVTGTCGKTTTKEMIKHVLLKKYKNVQYTHRSNNAQYMDLEYLLGIDDKTEAAVFEMGVGWPGELAYDCKHFQPQIRMILNIGVNHLLGCKTPEAYIKAKAEILEGLDPDTGILVLNSDDENIKKIDISRYKNLVYFGLSDNCAYRGKNIEYANEGMHYVLCHGKDHYDVYISGVGKHNVYNSLAAIAALNMQGLDINDIIHAISDFKNFEQHNEIRSGTGGCTIIDDTWNNSPTAMLAALEVLRDIANTRRKIAILGYMPQLNESEYSIQEYRKMGEKAVEIGTDMIIVVGEEAKMIGIRALELGMEKDKIYFENDGMEVYKLLEPFLSQGSVILLKVTHRVMTELSFKELTKKIIK